MAIDADHADIAVSRQCELLGLPRSSWYYSPQKDDEAVALNERLMRLIDRQHTVTPFYGVGRMTQHLCQHGHPVNVKRVRRLMRVMGLEAIYPKPRTSLKNPENKVYPYLLRDLTIDRCDQVWATDITYIPLYRGWAYLVAIMDWFSRYVLAWELSVTADASFCVSTLERALALGTPEIFNSDQGSQFTSRAFTGVLLGTGVRISMDGRGRVFDNIFVERLWRSVKYEDVYLRDYQTPPEAVCGLGRYFAFYNHARPHQALGWRTPAQVYGAQPTPAEARWLREYGSWEGGPQPSAAAAAFALRAHSAAAAPPLVIPP
jgi:putative transposase